VETARDDITWPVQDLLIHAKHVRSDHADGQHQAAHRERHEEREEGQARGQPLASDEILHDQRDRIDGAEEDDQAAEVDEDSLWDVGVREERIDRQLEALAKGVRARSTVARIVLNGDGGELEADVKHERPEEDVPLWILENRIEKSPREHAEGA